MKFTKEEAVKELTAKYAKPRYGAPEKWTRTIEESVDHAMKLIGEDSNVELGQFVENVVPFLETAAGFLLKETSDVANSFKAQIEELQKKNTTEPIQPQPNDELLKRIEALEKEKEESIRANAVKTKRSEITDMLKLKGVKDQEWIDLMLKKATISPETNSEQEAADFLEIYNKMHASNHDDDNPLPPQGNPSSKLDSIIAEAADIAKNRIV